MRRGIISLGSFAAIHASLFTVVLAQTPDRSSPPDSLVPIVSLMSIGAVLFPNPPPTMISTRAKCDNDGNVFVIENALPLPAIDMSRGISALPILKLSPGSKTTTPYVTPNFDQFREVSRVDFDVSPTGDVYLLLALLDSSSGASQEFSSYIVAKLRKEGALDSSVKIIDPPGAHMQPSGLSLFLGGNFLVSGTLVKTNGTPQPVTAVYDPAGRFIRFVKIPGANGAAASLLKSNTKETPEGAKTLADLAGSLLVSGPDGNVYQLQGLAHPVLMAISAGGEVFRQFDVPTPSPGLTATALGMAGKGSVFIVFSRVLGSNGGANSAETPAVILVLSTVSGQMLARYRVSPESERAGVPACAAGPDQFLYLTESADMQHQQVETFAPH